MKYLKASLGLLFLLAGSSLSHGQEQVIGGDDAQAVPAAPANVWATFCSSSTRGAAASCQLVQRAISAQTRRPIAALTLRFPAGGAANLLISAPVGVSLAQGVSFDVDGNGKQSLPFDICDPSSCYASTPLSAALLSAMQAGQKFNITVANEQKKTMTIPFSLAGFTASYNSVK